MSTPKDRMMEEIAARGGVGALLCAMQNHRRSPGVQDNACAALERLASEPEVPAAPGPPRFSLRL